MKDIIQLLPDSIANQIAAGEVIQRPSSVIKELLENAIDAGSTEVSVMIKDAGKTLIQVVDNGTGMSGTDARLSFERHATSKLRHADDLFSLRTKGFRGEALASIAAIARVEMKTKREEDELGQLLIVEGSEVKKQEPISVPTGTSIAVKNIFFNVPARRNFLKSNSVETRHILEEFHRLAIAHADIAFTLYQNDLEVYKLRPANLSQRIVQLLGKNHQQQLVSCQEETSLMNIRGYIGKPENSKRTRGEQYIFVNDRFIKNNYLNHAVLSAYEGLLQEKQFPFYALFIEIDPKHVDVNVHPTKTEIKFDDERSIYGIVRAAVKQALGTHNITPSLDFESDVNFEAIIKVPSGSAVTTKEERDYGQMKGYQLPHRNVEHWEKLYQATLDESKIAVEKYLPAKIMGSEVNRRETVGRVKRTTMQVLKRYILTPVRSGLMCVDYKAATERILFEKYLKNLENCSGASQQLLFPQTINLNPADFSLVMEIQSDISALGFAVEQIGKFDLVIRGVPLDAANRDAKSLLDGLLEQIKHFSSSPDVDHKHQLARSMARKVAVVPEGSLEQQEMEAVVDKLFGCENPNYTPGGEKTYIVLESITIENLFKT
jgi:DNA mismatch repair protein MutL